MTRSSSCVKFCPLHSINFPLERNSQLKSAIWKHLSAHKNSLKIHENFDISGIYLCIPHGPEGRSLSKYSVIDWWWRNRLTIWNRCVNGKQKYNKIWKFAHDVYLWIRMNVLEIKLNLNTKAVQWGQFYWIWLVSCGDVAAEIVLWRVRCVTWFLKVELTKFLERLVRLTQNFSWNFLEPLVCIFSYDVIVM